MRFPLKDGVSSITQGASEDAIASIQASSSPPLDNATKGFTTPKSTHSGALTVPPHASIGEPAAGSSASRSAPLQVYFTLGTDFVMEMKEENRIGPYKFDRRPRWFIFSLTFEPLATFLPAVHQLIGINNTANTIEREQTLRALQADLWQDFRFDPGWFVDSREEKVLELAARKVTPLVANTGRIVLTRTRIYFQPFNNVEPDPVETWRLEKVRDIFQQRHLLREVGVEIFTTDDKSVLFAFESKDAQNDFLAHLFSITGLTLTPTPDPHIMQLWQERKISNRDYLMYVNSWAGRTMNDLTQYPVFPWVIADYESEELDLNDPNVYRDLRKPIGALNEDRLELLQVGLFLFCGWK